MPVGDTNMIPSSCGDGMTTALLAMGKDRSEKLDSSYGDEQRSRVLEIHSCC
jgi:hypothetical protein